jgi:hypothetical protein
VRILLKSTFVPEMSYTEELPSYFPNVDSGNGMSKPVFLQYPMLNRTNITAGIIEESRNYSFMGEEAEA